MTRPPASAWSAGTPCPRSVPCRARRRRAATTAATHRLPDTHRRSAIAPLLAVPRTATRRSRFASATTGACAPTPPASARTATFGCGAPSPRAFGALTVVRLTSLLPRCRCSYNQGTLRCAADPAASSGVDALGNAVNALVRRCLPRPWVEQRAASAHCTRPSTPQPPTAIAAAVVVLGLFLCCCGVMLWACFRPCCSSGRKSRRKRRKRQEGRKRKKEQESEGRGHGSKGTRRSKRRRRKREKRNARRTRHRSRGDQPKSARLRRGHVKGDRRRAYDPEQGRPRRTQRARGHDEGWDPRYPALPPSQPPPPGPHGRWGGEWVPAEAGRGAGGAPHARDVPCGALQRRLPTGSRACRARSTSWPVWPVLPRLRRSGRSGAA